jgi:hypothetical protein
MTPFAILDKEMEKLAAVRGDMIGKVLQKLMGRSQFARSNPNATQELFSILGNHRSISAAKIPVGYSQSTVARKLKGRAPSGPLGGPVGVKLPHPSGNSPMRLDLPRNSNVAPDVAQWLRTYRGGL